LLVDDDAFNRDGMRPFFARAGFTVVEAGDEETALRAAREQPLDAAIVDLAIPPRPGDPIDHACGSRLAWQLKADFPALGIVVFSAYEHHGAQFLERIEAGARGIAYKLKGCQPAALLSAVEDVMAGRVVIDGDVRAGRRVQRDQLMEGLVTEDERPYVELAANTLAELAPRLREVVRLLAKSCNIEGIAKALDVSPKTAENYVGQVYDRLGLTEMGRLAPNLRKAVILVKSWMLYDLQHPTQ
jgi:DNA-binding NarL/FixJ family response regulator